MADDALFDIEPLIVQRKLPARARARRERAWPLANFSAEKQAEIAAAVAQPRPPAQWLYFGVCMLQSRAWYEWHWQRGIDPEAKRERLPAWLRQAVIERDGFVCKLCDGEIEAAADIHIDHIKPRALGGSDHMSNLQVAHSWCNMSKGARV